MQYIYFGILERSLGKLRGFSLCTCSLQGKTCFHYRFFPVKNTYTGKTLLSLQGGFAVHISILLPNKLNFAAETIQGRKLFAEI
jgi:hypothetical protein